MVVGMSGHLVARLEQRHEDACLLLRREGAALRLRNRGVGGQSASGFPPVIQRIVDRADLRLGERAWALGRTHQVGPQRGPSFTCQDGHVIPLSKSPGRSRTDGKRWPKNRCRPQLVDERGGRRRAPCGVGSASGRVHDACVLHDGEDQRVVARTGDRGEVALRLQAARYCLERAWDRRAAVDGEAGRVGLYSGGRVRVGVERGPLRRVTTQEGWNASRLPHSLKILFAPLSQATSTWVAPADTGRPVAVSM